MLAAGLLAGLGVGAAYFYGFPGDSPAPALPASGEAATSGQAPHLPAPIEGAPAPEFELLDLDGNTQRLSDLQGSVVVLNFWATWCAPCEAEMPMLNDTYTRYRDQGLSVLAINFDEPREDVQEFSDRLGLTFPVLLDPGGEVQELYRVRGYPTTFIVDRDGLIRTEHIGILSEANVSGYLADLGLSVP